MGNQQMKAAGNPNLLNNNSEQTKTTAGTGESLHKVKSCSTSDEDAPIKSSRSSFDLRKLSATLSSSKNSSDSKKNANMSTSRSSFDLKKFSSNTSSSGNSFDLKKFSSSSSFRKSMRFSTGDNNGGGLQSSSCDFRMQDRSDSQPDLVSYAKASKKKRPNSTYTPLSSNSNHKLSSKDSSVDSLCNPPSEKTLCNPSSEKTSVEKNSFEQTTFKVDDFLKPAGVESISEIIATIDFPSSSTTTTQSEPSLFKHSSSGSTSSGIQHMSEISPNIFPSSSSIDFYNDLMPQSFHFSDESFAGGSQGAASKKYFKRPQSNKNRDNSPLSLRNMGKRDSDSHSIDFMTDETQTTDTVSKPKASDMVLGLTVCLHNLMTKNVKKYAYNIQPSIPIFRNSNLGDCAGKSGSDSRTATLLLAIPSLRTIGMFIAGLLDSMNLTGDVAVVMAAYLSRLQTCLSESSDPTLHVGIAPDNWKMLVFGALLLAVKIWTDWTVFDVDLCDFIALELAQIVELERVILKHLTFDVGIDGSEYAKHYFNLRTIALQRLPPKIIDKNPKPRIVMEHNQRQRLFTTQTLSTGFDSLAIY
eukprot:Awhi_evm1s5939